MSVYKAEYIWIDGSLPTAKLRCKTRVIEIGTEPPVWGFDGSSTNQAEGHASDCALNPVFSCPDPVRGGPDRLVMCEVLNIDGTPHPSNKRSPLAAVVERAADLEMWFGIEQEYTFFDGIKPLGWPDNGFPAPQGGYYCGVGADEVYGREIVEVHLEACIDAGLAISGINAEVMPGQWEFQIGPLGPLEVSDQLWIARWLLYRIAEDYGVSATLHPKPVKGDWNGAGAHANFSSKSMRESINSEELDKLSKALADRHEEHIEAYGAFIDERLTGLHETCSYREFKVGVSDRGASVRVPWQVAQDGKGYLEDRRPNANIDPYDVTRLLTEAVEIAEGS
ncbi:MAG TPA: glutamine synthetase [Myxococcales bacterium]|nr:glutamine synthetase [Myxococcales bacterium]HAN30593.1 glutamine synthetase [Myxococcales bacterium]